MKNSKMILSNDLCKKCAKCCKNFPFILLSKNEIDSIERATSLSHDEFTNEKDKAGEYFLKFKDNGDCFFLKRTNCNYACDIYEMRPGVCKKYPSIPIQEEFCCECSKNS